MNIGVLAPFGSANQEIGLMVLISNYLKSCGHSVEHLLCDGAFASCLRDQDSHWTRDIHSCSKCFREQEQYANWSGAEKQNLSKFVNAEDFKAVQRILASKSVEQLVHMKFEDFDLFLLSAEYLKTRVGSLNLDFNDPSVIGAIKSAYLTTMLALCASQRYFQIFRPHSVFIGSTKDNIAGAFAACMKQNACDVIRFEWSISSRSVEIISPLQQDALACQLVLNDITSSRADIRAWPSDLIEIVRKICDYLAIPKDSVAKAVGQ